MKSSIFRIPNTRPQPTTRSWPIENRAVQEAGQHACACSFACTSGRLVHTHICHPVPLSSPRTRPPGCKGWRALVYMLLFKLYITKVYSQFIVHNIWPFQVLISRNKGFSSYCSYKYCRLVTDSIFFREYGAVQIKNTLWKIIYTLKKYRFYWHITTESWW